MNMACKDQDKLKTLVLILVFIIIFLYFGFLKTREETVTDTETAQFIEDRIQYFLSNLEAKEKDEIKELKNLQVSTLSNIEAKTKFFKIISMPLQSSCRIMKRIGGHWHVGGAGQHKAVDGDKFVCLDQILRKQNCIIYSFGLAADWTFEDMMDNMGCHIFAYDHTINAPATRGKNIKYFKTGLGFGESLKPLSQLIQENGHQTTEIDYLKIDIEEYEFSEGGFTDWIKSGSLKNVGQIAIELHVEHHAEKERQYIDLLQHLQDLYNLGFRVISHEPNMVKGPGPDGIYNFVEIVLFKVT